MYGSKKLSNVSSSLFALPAMQQSWETLGKRFITCYKNRCYPLANYLSSFFQFIARIYLWLKPPNDVLFLRSTWLFVFWAEGDLQLPSHQYITGLLHRRGVCAWCICTTTQNTKHKYLRLSPLATFAQNVSVRGLHKVINQWLAHTDDDSLCDFAVKDLCIMLASIIRSVRSQLEFYKKSINLLQHFAKLCELIWADVASYFNHLRSLQEATDRS